MNNDSNLTTIVGITGLLGTITLEHVNTLVGIAVGIVTLLYVGVKLKKEIKDDEQNK